jgi:hypothetical protein
MHRGPPSIPWQRHADLKRSLARRFEHDREGCTQAKSQLFGPVAIGERA